MSALPRLLSPGWGRRADSCRTLTWSAFNAGDEGGRIAAIDYHDLVDASPKRVRAGLEFGDHASRSGAVADQPFDLLVV
jgi:hypothetical protein